MSAEMKSWRNTSEAPTSAPLRPQTHRTSASMPYGNLASASNGPGRSGSGTPCTALNTVFSLLAYKGLIKACYNIAFTFCLVVFFAALSGIGYNPPSSAEGAALPISQQMEARKAPVLLKHGLIGAVHAASNDTTVNFLDITPPEPTEWSDARGGKQAFEQRQRERQFIQDSPADPHLDGEHAAHPHHVGEDNIFDKAKVVPEGHIEHEQQGSTVEVVHRRYAMREGEHNADAAADQVDVEQTEDGAGEEEEAPFVDVGEETSLEQQAMEVEAADDAFIEESAEAEDRVEQEQVEDDHKVALKLWVLLLLDSRGLLC